MSTNTEMPGNRELALAMQAKRRSSAASRHKNKAKYDRTVAKRQIRQEYC